MHRTTIELDDKVLKRLKDICARERKTFKRLVLELVRVGLEARGPQRKKPSLDLSRWITVKNPLPQGIDPADRSTYWPFLQRSLP